MARHPFLEAMPEPALRALAECAMEARFAAGERIFRQGDPANRFYLILTGRVALETTAGSGAAVPVQDLGPGDVLGWSWLFPPYTWNFDARALEPTEAIFFYGTRLREQCEEDHSLGYELIRRVASVVVERLQATRRELVRTRALARTP